MRYIMVDIYDLAGYLTDGYWEEDGYQGHAYDWSPGDVVTVNATGLNADGFTVLQAALAEYSAVLGVTFSYISGEATLTFDDENSGAYAGSSYYPNAGADGRGLSISGSCNVSKTWVANYGTAIGGYAYQTYIHEIGHMLGLGHSGHYNGSATYDSDATFEIDSWSVSIMSYFDQEENTNDSASRAMVTSLQIADLIALRELYGLSGTTRTGDSTYGYNSTEGAAYDLTTTSWYGGTTFTILDNGGTDTLDGSGYSDAQTIDLSSDGYGISSMGGETNNVRIFVDTIIENAIGGAGDDTITGNGISNRLTGGKGKDVLNGGAGNDILNGDITHNHDTHYGQIYRLYKSTLAREPDVEGLKGWATGLRAGASLESIVTGFVNSAEFQATYGSTSNEDFVTLLYNNVLGRSPDSGGFTHWTTLLNNGFMSREQVVLNFSESLEHINSTQEGQLGYSYAAITADYGDQVYRLYKATLDREPDSGGYESWITGLGEGISYDNVASGFVNSVEFQSKYGSTNNGEFVTLLYNNVLGRAPDGGGYAYWVGILDSSAMTRVQVVGGFANSAEFIISSDANYISYMRALGINDTLEGGAGDDTMLGGMWSDMFVFNANHDGNDRVLDLEAWDLLRFDSFGYANAQAAISNMTQSGSDVVFSDQGVIVTFTNVELAIFTSDMITV